MKNTESIPVGRIIDKLDSLLSAGKLDEAVQHLIYWQNEAEALGDRRGLATVLSEQMGLYRRTGDSEQGLSAVQRGLILVEREGISDSVSGATIMLNAATTMKAFGQAAEALSVYQLALDTYRKRLTENDYLMAGLYNNYASALTELQKFDEAEKMYLRAAAILECRGDHKAELAVTYVNLAHLVCERNVEDSQAEEYMRMAWKILDSDLPHDGNYAFVASKCAPSFGYFGFFNEEKELNKRVSEIYEK